MLLLCVGLFLQIITVLLQPPTYSSYYFGIQLGSNNLDIYMANGDFRIEYSQESTYELYKYGSQRQYFLWNNRNPLKSSPQVCMNMTPSYPPQWSLYPTGPFGDPVYSGVLGPSRRVVGYLTRDYMLHDLWLLDASTYKPLYIFRGKSGFAISGWNTTNQPKELFDVPDNCLVID